MATRKRLSWSVGVLAATALLFAGCGTFANLTEDGGLRIYGGVTSDLDKLLESYSASPNVVVYSAGIFASAVDMPFSAVGDTLTLPYVVPAALGWTGSQSGVPAKTILRPSVDDPPAN